MERIEDEKLLEYLETGKLSDRDAELLKTSKKTQSRLKELREILKLMKEPMEKDTPVEIRWALDAAIREEKDSLGNGKSFLWMQVAASIAILILGFWLGKASTSQDEQIALLQQQIAELHEVTLTGVLKTHSASERILAVNQIEASSSTSSNRLIETLIETVNTDESANVRYEAIQALEKFANRREVRTELVNSLELQSDPLIQIALIRILVDAKEKSALAPLKKMIENEQVIPEVKEQAQTAIDILI